MKIPELPTDNLYKFMAISGIIIYAISFIPNIYLYNLRIDQLNIEKEVNILGLKVNWNSVDMKGLKNKTRLLEEKTYNLEQDTNNGLEKNDIDYITTESNKITTEISEIEIKLTQIIQTNREIELSQANKTHLLKKNSYLAKIIFKLSYVAIIIQFAGGLLSLFGFSLWYTKLQRHLDILLREQINMNNRKQD